jgi:hypothetical protein
MVRRLALEFKFGGSDIGGTSAAVLGSDLLCLWFARVGLGGGAGVPKGFESRGATDALPD